MIAIVEKTQHFAIIVKYEILKCYRRYELSFLQYTQTRLNYLFASTMSMTIITHSVPVTEVNQ